MLSVLIINNEIYEKYIRYAYFFNWFEDNGDIVVCPWNKSAAQEDDIEAMLPQLISIIKNEPQWDAYIVDSPFDSMSLIEKDFKNKTQFAINPYERAGCEDYNIETDALLKLVYFLGGRGVEKLPFIETFQFKAVRPNNIFLITPRIFEDLEMQKNFLQWKIIGKKYGSDPMAIDSAETVDFGNSWLLSNDSDAVMLYSNFWERYDYPPNCRFLVYNMPARTNLSYDDAWFTLWLSVLSLALNTFQSAELGPYKVYVINALISDEGVASFLNKFYSMLLDAKDAVDKEMDNEVKAIKEQNEDITAGDLTDATPIYVNFPEVNMDRLFADREDFGLTKDRPKEDEVAWRDQMLRTKEMENKLFKAVDRGKNEAINVLNKTFLVDLPLLKRRKITQYAMEDMIEKMNDLETEMVSLNTGYKASRLEFDRNQKKASDDVVTYMQKRIRFKPAMATILATVLVYLVGFMPYIVASVKRNFTSFLVSLLVSIGACCLLGFSGYLSLKWLYSRMKQKLNNYNQAMLINIQSVSEGAKIQSQYLSDLLDYMEKYQLVTHAQIDRSRIEKLNKLTASSERFDNALNQCSAIARLRHLTLTRWQGDLLSESLSTDLNVPIYLYEDVKGMKMPLNRDKDVLNVPFPFVNGLELTVEELFECETYTDYSYKSEEA